MFKKFNLIAIFVFLTAICCQGQDTLFVWRSNQPVVTGRRQNIVLDLKLKGKVLNSLDIAVCYGEKTIKKVELYYTGTTSMLSSRTTSSALKSHQALYGGGQKIYMNPAYAILKNSVEKPGKEFTFKVDAPLVLYDNYFYVSVESDPTAKLTDTFSITIKKAVIDGKEVIIDTQGEDLPVRLGTSVKDAGEDDVNSYRIPGIVTANDGTLVSVFDIRRHTSIDLQEDIQIGVSRSKDNGRTWESTITAMDMRGTGPLPDSQNGTGDPSILIDKSTGKLYIMALWTYGIGGSTSWQHCKQGMSPEEGAAQVLIVESEDNGKTWSKPRNITPSIKNPDWYILLQGPGRGISMEDGTLVFPFQYKDEKDMPASTIIYSKDKGKTWTLGSRAVENTTEAQVVELGKGELLLNMRDNRGGSRSVSTTDDMGKTWKEHPTSRTTQLQEPVCMASLIKVNAKDNCLGRDLLLFSNPNTVSGRNHITIKASLDQGMTWKEENSLLLDAENCWGYSCLTMIDSETVGILYESSKSNLLFQAIKLKDIIKR